MEALQKAEQLRAELDRLRPLDAEAEARVLQKLRLDWNYHSNNIEGNSLTFGETKALILFGVTAQGKPLKDHFEITGHDEAIKWVEELVRDEAPLSESFIRQLHQLLLKEDRYEDAQTADGKPTRRLISVGKYKTQPNHVVTVTGEKFYFATPEETPAKMQELIEWFRAEKEKSDVNPIILASLFHYSFIRIHPFDDGNGRVARILMNFILMQYGYPPVIIKTEDKENYYRVLTLADADEIEPFIVYIAENLVRSLELMLRGARGESVEEPNDLDKELALLDRSFDSLGDKAEILLSDNVLEDQINNSIGPFTEEFIKIGEKFQRFYLQSKVVLILNPSHFVTTTRTQKALSTSVRNLLDDFWEVFTDFVEKDRKENDVLPTESYEIGISYVFEKFNRQHDRDINFVSEAIFVFDELTFAVRVPGQEVAVQKVYNKNLTRQEISDLCRTIANEHLEFLKEIV